MFTRKSIPERRREIQLCAENEWRKGRREESRGEDGRGREREGERRGREGREKDRRGEKEREWEREGEGRGEREKGEGGERGREKRGKEWREGRKKGKGGIGRERQREIETARIFKVSVIHELGYAGWAMSSREPPVSISLVPRLQAWPLYLAFHTGSQDQNSCVSRPFTHRAMSPAPTVSSFQTLTVLMGCP